MICCLPVQHFSGLVSKAAPPTVNSTRLLARMYLRPGIFIFYKVRSPTPWIFAFSGFSEVSILYNLSRAPLHSWVSFQLFHIYNIPKWYHELEGSFHITWYLGSVPIFLEVYLVLMGRLFHPAPIIWWNSWGIFLGPLVHFFKGIQSFLRDCFAITRDIPAIIIPTYFSCCHLKNKVSWGDLSFSPIDVYIYIYINIYIWMYIYIYLYISMRIYIYIYVYIHIYART